MYLSLDTFRKLASEPGRLFVRYEVSQVPVYRGDRGPVVTIHIFIFHEEKFYEFRYAKSHEADPKMWFETLSDEAVSTLLETWSQHHGWTEAVSEAAVAEHKGQGRHRSGYHEIPETSWLIAAHVMRMRDFYDLLMRENNCGLDDVPRDLQFVLLRRLSGLVNQKFAERIRVGGIS